MTVMQCISLADMLTKIKITDLNDNFLAKGNWYQDDILDHIRNHVDLFTFDAEENEMIIRLNKVVE